MPTEVPADRTAAAARLEEIAPGYLGHVRSAAARLAVSNHGPSDVRAALVDVEDTATIDVEIPTASRQPLVRVLKAVLKRLMKWYLRYLGQQVTAFGQAVSGLGVALANRADATDARTDQLGARTDQLGARTDQLGARTDQLDALVDELQAQVAELGDRIGRIERRPG